MANVVAWLSAHSALVAGAVVGLLDLVFALAPSWESNGVLHWVYLQAKKLLPGSSGS